jgi:hypothetical protein
VDPSLIESLRNWILEQLQKGIMRIFGSDLFCPLPGIGHEVAKMPIFFITAVYGSISTGDLCQVTPIRP